MGGVTNQWYRAQNMGQMSTKLATCVYCLLLPRGVVIYWYIYSKTSVISIANNNMYAVSMQWPLGC